MTTNTTPPSTGNEQMLRASRAMQQLRNAWERDGADLSDLSDSHIQQFAEAALSALSSSGVSEQDAGGDQTALGKLRTEVASKRDGFMELSTERADVCAGILGWVLTWIDAARASETVDAYLQEQSR